MKYEGIMTALVTPLNEQGEVMENSLRQIIKFQIKNQVQSLLILGGTGEYVQLNNAQRKRAIDIAVSEAKGQIPVVAGIIEPGLGATIEMGIYAKTAGADAIMVVSPYYVHPTQDGIMDYYRKIDRAVNMPLILYNIPYRTSVNILPTSVETLVNEIQNIVAIKECTPNIGQIIELIRRVGDKIAVLSGEEFFAVAEMIIGAKGAVMASANAIPEVWVKMWKLVEDKKINEAIQMNSRYFPFFKAIFLETNPGPLKAAMKMMGLPADCLSTPLVVPSADTIKALQASMKELKIIQ
ncbi:MAG: 4-hydroxy-tetrahydrodipicolinate synthase [Negativicutes bacterium]